MHKTTVKTWLKLGDERRAVTTLVVAILLPVLIGFVAFAIGACQLYYRSELLRQTVVSAALAGASKLTTYYTSSNHSTSYIVNAAQTFASANEPSQTYGTVVPAGDVVVGNWDPVHSTFTSLASSGGTSPNAVQITGLHTAANGNAISVFLGGILGLPTLDMTRTAIASFGTGMNFDTIILNDLSQSFSSQIPQQRAADLAILNCVKNTSASTSMYGITGFDGHSGILEPLTQASTNLSALTTYINGTLNHCNSPLMPTCSGSNVAAGLYSAIQQFSSISSTNTIKNIIIITDGVPNASSTSYGTVDGVAGVCSGTNCTDANLLTAAQNQATAAYAAGINVSTIYYSGDTPANQQTSYANSLATLRKGTGVSLVAPTSASITSVFGGFCATMNSAAVSLN